MCVLCVLCVCVCVCVATVVRVAVPGVVVLALPISIIIISMLVHNIIICMCMCSVALCLARFETVPYVRFRSCDGVCVRVIKRWVWRAHLCCVWRMFSSASATVIVRSPRMYTSIVRALSLERMSRTKCVRPLRRRSCQICSRMMCAVRRIIFVTVITITPAAIIVCV